MDTDFLLDFDPDLFLDLDFDLDLFLDFDPFLDLDLALLLDLDLDLDLFLDLDLLLDLDLDFLLDFDSVFFLDFEVDLLLELDLFLDLDLDLLERDLDLLERDFERLTAGDRDVVLHLESLADLDLDLSVHVGDLCLDTTLGEVDFDGDIELDDFSFFPGDGEQECGDLFLFCSLAVAVVVVCVELLTDSASGLLLCVGHGCISDLEVLSTDMLLGTSLLFFKDSELVCGGKMVTSCQEDLVTTLWGVGLSSLNCDGDSCRSFLLQTPSTSTSVCSNVGLFGLDVFISLFLVSMASCGVASRIIIFCITAWFFSLTSCNMSPASLASSAVSKLSFLFFFLCLCLPPSSFFLCFFFFFLLSFFFLTDFVSTFSVLLGCNSAIVVLASSSLSLDLESLSSSSLLSESPVCVLTCSPLIIILSSSSTSLGESGTFNELKSSFIISSDVLFTSKFSI